MKFRNDRDYVFANMLPYVQLTHDNVVDQTREFTAAEADRLYMDGLPLLMNHRDGEFNPTTGEQEPLLRVGTVLASRVARGSCMMVGEIDPRSSDAATFTSNAVARGVYRSVSLGNTVETRIKASTGTTYLVKTPDEVSLCKEGRRGGSTIRAYCPGRETLERLYQHAPDDLEALINRHGYREAVIHAGASLDDDPARYITAVETASQQRWAEELDRYRLAPRSIDTMASSQENRADETMTADTNKASQQQADDTLAADTEQQRSVATPLAENNESVAAKTALAEAVKAQQEKLEIMKQFEALKAEKAQSDAQLAKIHEKEKAKDDETRDTIEKSITQHMVMGQFPKDQIVETVADFRSKYNEDRTSGLRFGERQLMLASKASSAHQQIQKSEANAVAEQQKRVTNDFIAQEARKLQALRAQEAGISLQGAASTTVAAATPSSSSIDFDSLSAMVDATKTAFETRFEQQAGGVETHVGDKRKEAPVQLCNEPEKAFAEVKRFAIKASSDQQESYDAAAVFAQQCKTLGRLPWYEEVAMHAEMQKTGKFKASANGQRVEECVVRATRSKPAHLSAANFNPIFDAQCNDAMTNARFGTRGGAASYLQSMGRMAVEYGNTVELHD